jgi:hypothetical protein
MREIIFRGMNYVLFYDNIADESLCVNTGSWCLHICSFHIILVACGWRIVYSTNIDSAGSSTTSLWKKKICFRDRHAGKLQQTEAAFHSKM